MTERERWLLKRIDTRERQIKALLAHVNDLTDPIDPEPASEKEAPRRPRSCNLEGPLSGLELWIWPDGSAQLRTMLSKVLLHCCNHSSILVSQLRHDSVAESLKWTPGQPTTKAHLKVLREALALDGVTPGHALEALLES